VANSGSQCDQATLAEIFWLAPGNNYVSSGIFNIVNLEHEIGVITPLGPIANIRVTNDNHQPVDCCPAGYTFDPIKQVCAPTPEVLPPPPKPPDTPPPPTCPDGFHWDDTASACVPDLVPGGGFPIPPPEGGGSDTDWQEQVGAALVIIIEILIKIQEKPEPPEPPEKDECCLKIVAALGPIAVAIQNIANALAGGITNPGTPVDLTPIIAELEKLKGSIDAIGVDLGANTAKVVAALDPLKQIAEELGKGTNLDGIVEQLKRLNVLKDLPPEFARQMLTDKVIPKQYSGAMQGTPTEWLHDLLAAAAMISPMIGWVEHLLGDDKDYEGGLRTGRDLVDVITSGLMKSVRTMGLAPDEHTTANLTAGFKKYLSTADTITAPLVKPLIEAIVSQLKPPGGIIPSIGNIHVDPDLPVESATGVALSASAAAWLLSYAGIDAGEPLAHLAELFGGMVGFEELRDVQIGPLLRHGIAKVANMRARALFAQELPASAQAAHWVARGHLDEGKAITWMLFNGTGPEVAGPELRAGYSAISPRALATLVQDAPFPRDKMAEILQDNAVWPDHAHFLLDLLEYNSTKNVRNSYVSELLTAHAKGVMGEDELHQELSGLGWSDQAIHLVEKRALLQRRVTLAAKVEAQIKPLVESGGITSDEGLHQLEAAGLQDWYAQLEITLATTKAEVTRMRKLAAAEAKLEAEQKRAATRAAVAEFQSGGVDLPGLVAALTLAGVDPAVTASIGVVQEATRSGRMRLVYGELLHPAAARVKLERVAAIGQQVKDQLITRDRALAELTDLKVDAADANALVARWEATLKKSPGAAQLVNPLTGQP